MLVAAGGASKRLLRPPIRTFGPILSNKNIPKPQARELPTKMPDKSILVMSTMMTAHFDEVMGRALDEFWPNHWPVKIFTAEKPFTLALLEALEGIAGPVLLTMGDQIPMAPTNQGMLDYAFQKISRKEWDVALMLAHKRIVVEGEEQEGWRRVAKDSNWRFNLNPLICGADLLRKLAQDCLNQKIVDPWKFEWQAASQCRDLQVFRTVAPVDPFPVLRHGFMVRGWIKRKEYNVLRRQLGLSDYVGPEKISWDGFLKTQDVGQSGDGFHYGGDPATYYPEMWSSFVKDFNIKSVLDVGCGEGHSSKFFADLGCSVSAIDGSPKVLEHNVFKDVVVHDLSIGPFAKPVDLVWCSEVVEHIEEKHLKNVLDTLCQGKWLLLSHAQPGQKGTHHVNCQNDDYWIKKIEERGYIYEGKMTEGWREKTSGFWKKNGLVFKRGEASLLHRLQTRRIGSFEFDVMIARELTEKKPLLLCGLWCGEFGWELGYWRPRILKALRENRDHHRIVVGDFGHQCLYDGLYDEYWALKQLPEGERRGIHKNDAKGYAFEQAVNVALNEGLQPEMHIVPRGRPDPVKGETIGSTRMGEDLLKKANLKEPFYIIFPRSGILHTKNPSRIRPKEEWEALSAFLSKSGTVVNSGRRGNDRNGSLFDVKNTTHVEDLAELRYQLDLSIAVLKHCQKSFNTDSGGMHLALGAGADVVAFGKLEGFPSLKEPKNVKDAYEYIKTASGEATRKSVKSVSLLLDVHIVDHCNLNCADCSHNSHLSPTKFHDLEELTSQIRALQEVCEIKRLHVVGGEPLLHPRIDDCLQMFRSALPDAAIYLLSNGMLKERLFKLLPTLKKEGINTSISKYPINVDYHQIWKTLKDGGASVKVGMGKWRKWFNDDGNEDWSGMKWCESRAGASLYDGEVYPCCNAPYLKFRTKLEEAPSVKIDENFPENWLKLLKTFPFKICRWCLKEKPEIAWRRTL